jgi:hypothetical protein
MLGTHTIIIKKSYLPVPTLNHIEERENILDRTDIQYKVSLVLSQLIEYMGHGLETQAMKVQYNSLTMLVSVYARIWAYLVTCVLYFFPHNQ